VLGSAVRDGVINANPIHRLEQRERPEVERRDFPLLDRADVAKLISETPERYRTLVALSLLTGLRQSEALGLTFADLDLKGGVLRVRRQRDRTGALVSPKTRAAKRDVPLPPSLVTMLKAHKALAFECGFAKPTDPVFADEMGEPLGHRRIVRAGLDVALVASGLPRLTWHDLRHVAASVLIGQDASVAYVARILGHASPSVTLGIYAHLFDAREHAERHRDRMEADFADALVLS
jgi:integrase